jgi:hypothetical protein
MIADVDPIPLGSVAIAFDKLFSKTVDTQEVFLRYHPRDDTVSLEFRYQTIRYEQYWDRAGREKFVAAVRQYHADFAERKLSTKGSKSRTAYGKFQGRTEWGQFAFSTKARSYPRVDLGYRFKGKSPYFTVIQREARDTSLPTAERDRMSLQITAYFTRKSADDLSAFFDPSYLEEVLAYQGIQVEGDEGLEAEPYF